jgi:hypothetical protein
MNRTLRHGRFAVVAALALATMAHADGQARAPIPLLAAYKQECSACHVAYPPGLLPPASWARILSTLPRHYGTDASLDAPTVTALSTWLNANAGGSRRGGEAPPEDRITRSAWFVRKHDEVPPAAWKRAAVRSPSNCAACHAGADQGDFDEHRVRIPR